MLRLAFFTLRIRFRCRSQCRYRLREGSLACRRCFISSCFAFRRTVLARIARRTACRAKRRYDELTEKGETCDLAAIEADIIERDKRDMEREFAPLRQAEDATYVDSSDMTIDEVITAITDLIH